MSSLRKNDEKRLGLVSTELWTRPPPIHQIYLRESKSSALELEFRANFSMTKTPSWNFQTKTAYIAHHCLASVARA
ncbi:unnamed protein product [Brassica napus]|uniref:(rape) hypothetical protein n=1 Tax=Brassica napus TaxID=3708 RepID=A0A816W0C2_BRANA|nr:unnamed protein product [Brassica napus]